MPLIPYAVEGIFGGVAWAVEITEEFEQWWNRLSDDERVSIDGMVRVLEAHAPSLEAFSVRAAGSRYETLRQLLVPHQDRDICVAYVSDDARQVLVLLIGTTAFTGDEDCPPEEVALAESVYERYLRRSR